MAIPAQNIAYLGAAPVANGSGILAFGGSSMQELSYLGTATFVLDGTLTTATINYIDGTAALPFTPSALMVVRVGGTGLASIHAYGVDGANAGVSGTVTFSAAGTSTNTIKVAVFILK